MIDVASAAALLAALTSVAALGLTVGKLMSPIVALHRRMDVLEVRLEVVLKAVEGLERKVG